MVVAEATVRILLTGSEGRLCSKIVKPALSKHTIIPFDLVLGNDMLDKNSLYCKMKDCDVVVHTAGISGPQCKDVSLYEKVSVQGGKNVIDIAQELGCLVVFFSSMAYYGTDAWMRDREEKGPVAGDGVAIPKYLPIDINHPSIEAQEKLSEYGGVYYGLSKAKIEGYAKDRFVSLRLSGCCEVTKKRERRWEKIRLGAKKGKAPFRKMWLYSLAGTCTPKCLARAVKWGVDQKESAVKNVGVFGTGLKDVCSAYFPTLEPADQIFV